MLGQEGLNQEKFEVISVITYSPQHSTSQCVNTEKLSTGVLFLSLWSDVISSVDLTQNYEVRIFCCVFGMVQVKTKSILNYGCKRRRDKNV